MSLPFDDTVNAGIENWGFVQSRGPAEQKRLRYCRGCKYLSSAGQYGCCNKYIETGERRQKDADGKCLSFDQIPGYQIPERFLRWRKKVDEEERRKQKEEERRIAYLRELAEQKRTDPGIKETPRGRPLKWDAAYAFELYKQGYYFFEIAEVVNASSNTVLHYAERHEWNKKVRNVRFRRHDVEKAKQEYLDYLSRIEQEDK